MQRQSRAEQLLERIKKQKHALKYMTDVALSGSFHLQTLAPEYKVNDKTVSNIIGDIAHLRALPLGIERVREQLEPTGELLLSTNMNTGSVPEKVVLVSDTEHNLEAECVSVSVETEAVLMVSEEAQVSISNHINTTESDKLELDYDTIAKLIIPDVALRNCRCDRLRKCFCGCCDHEFISKIECNDFSPEPCRVDMFRGPKTEYEREFVAYAESVTDGRVISCLEHFPPVSGQGASRNWNPSWKDLILESEQI